ncbi:MAG: M10 family metallopeptidase C-terminal domain-containing protein [Sphingosinicella sp.]|nr:M10 family metallopeptidase C-terminal domain-containing protein [Sphingosinicella sp.]
MANVIGTAGDDDLHGTSGDDVIEALAGQDILRGFAGNDTLIGGSGADTLIGGIGDDIYYADEAGDIVVESAGEGYDRIYASNSYTLRAGAYVEALTTADASGTTAINLTGNEFDNFIGGNAGANVLNGGGGADTLVGLGGDDSYYVDGNDLVIEGAAEGAFDRIFVSASYTLAAGVYVEALTTADAAGTAAINLTGNEIDNFIGGNDGANVLNGGGGADTLVGRGGNDRLIGGSGADTLIGGTGDDWYYVDQNDTVIEGADEGGFDRIFVSSNYTLGVGVRVEAINVENALDTNAINLTGNEYDNFIGGNAGANVLTGGGGVDTLIGLGGNDSYYVDSNDLVVEGASEGTFDRIFVSASYTQAAGVHVEALTTTDAAATSAINLTGNELDNFIGGNAGANILDGGTGNDTLSGLGGDDRLTGGSGVDTMIGGTGNDFYYVDDAGDTVVEGAGEGTFDRIFASTSYTQAAGVHVEALNVADAAGTAAINLTGNELDNYLGGNAGANVLNGGGGNDTLASLGGDDRLIGGIGADHMTGGLGDDWYYVDNVDDVVIEGANEGAFDRVFTSVNFFLGSGLGIEAVTAADPASISALNITGNEFANFIAGNAGVNVLNGRGGVDTMVGLGGDDTYYVDDAGDVVIEGAGEGTFDRVNASVSYTLAAGVYVEALTTADAASPINLTGNEFGNFIGGNGAANVLDGGGGADTLAGSGGADSFAFTSTLGGGNIDSITDFTAAEGDTILLGAVFTGLASGALGSGAFAIGQAAAEADDRIIYNSATGALLFDADGLGGNAAVQFASVTPGLTINASHFRILGAPNNLPALNSGSSATVAENAPADTIIYTATASDADGDTIVFSLSGQHADSFRIDPLTGQVRLKAPADYEVQSSYNFTVTAVDSSGQGSSRNVTLAVTDLNENPSGAPYNVTDIEPNDSVGAAQVLDRGRFTPVSDSTVPDGTLPTARIQGSITTNTDADFFTVTLQAGELLILDVDGTTTLDSFLRVFGPDGLLVAMNDDQGSFDAGSSPHSGISHNLDSLVRFRAPTSGSYTFSIQSFADATSGPTSSGSYTINVSIGPVATRAQIDEENIQALMSGSTWSTTNLTYGFTTSADQYGSGEATDERATFQALNSTQQNAVRVILPQISNFTNLAFTELTSNPGSAQMRYARSNDPKTAHAYYPGSGDGGDSWYNIDGGRFDNPTVGNYAWLTFVHETGHALGLKHGHESPALSPDRDSMEFSVMTYRGFIGAPGEGGFRNESWGFAQTFMMYDIASLQRMYGADFGYNSGDSNYSWNGSTGAFLINGATQWTPGGNRVFMTLWDGGGNDTYNLSNYSNNVTIDLRPGEWTITSQVQLANLGDGHIARGNVANTLLYNNDTRSLIENAVSGSGNDILVANQVANRLTGGSGADTFRFASNTDVGIGVLRDTITDFLSGSDKIDLSGLDANSNVEGDQGFSFIGTGAFTGAAGQLRYDVSGGSINLLGDLNGDGVADFAILLENNTTLVTSDFIL